MKHSSAIFAILLALVASANATPINITTSGGADVTAALGSDLGNFSESTVLSWLTSDVITYNSLNSSSLPTPTTVAGQTGLTGGTGGNSISLNVTGYDYLFFHWGGQNSGWVQAFYVGGSTGDFSFNSSAIGTGSGPSVGGLSFYSFYGPTTNSVPDGGTTIMMLGATLSGLSLMVRRFKK